MIYYYRSLISEQEKRKKRFNTLKSSLNGSVVPALSKIYDNLINASKYINNGLVIDGDSGDGESIMNNATCISDLKSKITGSVLNEINSEITKCDSNISYYYRKIKEIQEEQESGG